MWLVWPSVAKLRAHSNARETTDTHTSKCHWQNPSDQSVRLSVFAVWLLQETPLKGVTAHVLDTIAGRQSSVGGRMVRLQKRQETNLTENTAIYAR